MSCIKKCVLAGVILALATATCFADVNQFFTKDVYKEGVQDESVKLLQQSLKVSGDFKEVEVSDLFGQKTKEAVMSFQEDQNLTVDGIAGEDTINKIIELGLVPMLSESLYKKGMKHKDIPVIQGVLHTGGYYSTYEFSNLFDEETEEAVIAFQTEYGLDADGIIGNASISKLKELNWIVEEKSIAINTSRGTSRRFGEYINWSDARKLLPVGTEVTVQDFQTGKTFNIFVGYGTLHADVEPLTAYDTKVMKEIWGGEFTWARRPVLVYYGDRVLAGSLNFQPHAGREDKPALEYVSNRSTGFGSGKNYDLVKGNDVSGVICLHFKGSKVHASKKLDAKHQANVKTAAGL